ncbi:MAG: MFS transporter [Anaerolineae bacterium]
MFASLQRLFSKIPGFSQTGRFSLAFLNAAQFLGALNDNIFKLIVAFLLIDVLGPSQASDILWKAGAIYVIPFLLFSSAAGILADRFSKQRLLISMKAAEIVLMIFALLAFGVKSEFGSFFLLFLLSTHSALFGPSKYGIIPEIVPKEKVSKANGLITSCTYLAIIIGSFLASFLTEITGHRYVYVASACLLFATFGFIASFGIKPTLPQGSKKTINPLFLREIYRTLRICYDIKYLFPTVLGSAFFLFVGAFTQLNIIPFAIENLHLNEVAGGYLFLATALGIAVGAFIAGKASKKRIELGLSCLSAFFIALCFLLLSFFSSSISSVAIVLFVLGIFGGSFIVPFDSFLQVNSPDEKRGQVIAAANFLSFFGVLLASVALYFFSQILGISPASGFAFIGLLTFLVFLVLTLRLSDLALPYFSKKLIKLMSLDIKNLELIEKSLSPALVLQKPTWVKAFLLMGIVPSLRLLLPRKKGAGKLSFATFFESVERVNCEKDLETLFDVYASTFRGQSIPCLYLNVEIPLEESVVLKNLFKKHFFQLVFVDIFEKKELEQTVIAFSKKMHYSASKRF